MFLYLVYSLHICVNYLLIINIYYIVVTFVKDSSSHFFQCYTLDGSGAAVLFVDARNT